MAVSLSVPNFTTRVLTEVETKPAKVEKWLAELPLLNVAESARKLYSTLCIYNRVELDAKTRFRLLELYRYPIEQICQELRKQYVGQSLPLAEKYQNSAEQNRHFKIELAYGYKRLVLQSQDPKSGLTDVDLATAIQRAIRYLVETLVVSYQTYAPYPGGIWMEIHALFREADERKLAELRVSDPLNRANGDTSVMDSYKHAILLDIADPYHLPPRATDRVHAYLDRWSHKAQLLPAPDNFDPTCQFLIDRQADRSTVPLANDGSASEHNGDLRLLNTVELARLLHEQLGAVKFDQAPQIQGLDEQFGDEAGQELLHRLISVWGLHPKRQFRRLDKSGGEIELVRGVDRINYHLLGKQKFQTSSNFVGPMPKRNWLGKMDKGMQSKAEDDDDAFLWSVQDESAGGYSLARSGIMKSRINVGDIVATRIPAPGTAITWEIAVVRWLKSPTPSQLEIGLQRIAPRAEPIAIKMMLDDKNESDFILSLLLPEIKPLNQAETIIAPRGVYKSERVLYLDNGYRLFPIIATELIEMTPAFERFRFKPAKV